MKEIWVWIQAALAAGGFLGWFLGGWGRLSLRAGSVRCPRLSDGRAVRRRRPETEEIIVIKSIHNKFLSKSKSHAMISSGSHVYPKTAQNIYPVHSPAPKTPKHQSCSHAKCRYQSRSLAPEIRPLDLFPRSDILTILAHQFFTSKPRRCLIYWTFHTLTYQPSTSMPRTQRGSISPDGCLLSAKTGKTAPVCTREFIQGQIRLKNTKIYTTFVCGNRSTYYMLPHISGHRFKTMIRRNKSRFPSSRPD